MLDNAEESLVAEARRSFFPSVSFLLSYPQFLPLFLTHSQFFFFFSMNLNFVHPIIIAQSRAGFVFFVLISIPSSLLHVHFFHNDQ